MIKTIDFVVIGAGIAGASAGAELARLGSVLVLEAEGMPGYHATGRSAAYFAPSYGNAVVRAVTAAAEPFYREPTARFSEAPLLRPRDALFIARTDQLASIAAMHAEIPTLRRLERADITARVPLISDDYAAEGLLDTGGGDLDVDAILQGFLRQLRALGGRLETGRPVTRLDRNGPCWRISAGAETYESPVVINAAGAWADAVAELANLPPLGIEPRRRTALLIDPPADTDISEWPLVIDVDETFYFKPDAGNLLVSPADATPSAPCDAMPDELDVAIAVDRFCTATGRDVRRVKHRWAGLRSFAPDDTFVLGFDPLADGFFWLAGQGGYGVQTAPAMAWLTADLASSNSTRIVDPQIVAAMAPARFR